MWQGDKMGPANAEPLAACKPVGAAVVGSTLPDQAAPTSKLSWREALQRHARRIQQQRTSGVVAETTPEPKQAAPASPPCPGPVETRHEPIQQRLRAQAAGAAEVNASARQIQACADASNAVPAVHLDQAHKGPVVPTAGCEAPVASAPVASDAYIPAPPGRKRGLQAMMQQARALVQGPKTHLCAARKLATTSQVLDSAAHELLPGAHGIMPNQVHMASCQTMWPVWVSMRMTS